MSSDFLHSVLSNVWVLFLVILLFGGSIFVHELGHFLLARWRGAHVERFSIGFGPAIVSWRGNDGVEYRISWIPLGGYVLLPQLADLSAIEGETRFDVGSLPPVNYTTKMLVFAAGAAFNVLFAFLLACIVWLWVGQPTATGLSSTTVAEVLPTIRTTDGREVPSPAAQAGLKSGDVIVAIDGNQVLTFGDIQEQIALSSGWRNGERQTILTVRRDGKTLDLSVRPVISGPDKVRMVGFSPAARKLVIAKIMPGSSAEKAGLLAEDQIMAIEGNSTLSLDQLAKAFRDSDKKPFDLTVLRAGTPRTIRIERPKGTDPTDPGIALKTEYVFTHPSPFEQVGNCVGKTFGAIGALINPRSDIGISHAAGPISIINSFWDVSRAGLPFALWFTILVNVNLAIFNLLPVPVLDGGQMLFATIAQLRGRALPTKFVMATQSVFIVLIFALIGYISLFVDIPRIARERADSAPANNGPARGSGTPSTTPSASPAPMSK